MGFFKIGNFISSYFNSIKMSSKNQNVRIKKNAIVKKKENASPASSSIASINLSKFADQLSLIALKEKKSKDHIYLYPEGFSKEDLSGEKGKKFRNSIRNKMKTFSNNILLYAKMNRIEDLEKEIASFLPFYKEKFRINDLSIASISSSQDESKIGNFSLMLSIIKECKK